MVGEEARGRTASVDDFGRFAQIARRDDMKIARELQLKRDNKGSQMTTKSTIQKKLKASDYSKTSPKNLIMLSQHHKENRLD